MTDRHPHIIVAVYSDVDIDFALIPITPSMVRILANQLKDVRGHGSLAEAVFWDGHPVFFERPEEGFGEDDYSVVRCRPDVHWRHFKGTDAIRRVIYQEGQQWHVRWRATRESTEFDTAGVPVTALAAARNRYLKPQTVPMVTLMDGTPLYPAYHPLRPGERCRRAMRFWDGASGEWVGVTLDGRLFRQRQYWGSDKPRADEWQPFRLAYA
jgi:hypothetical protein